MSEDGRPRRPQPSNGRPRGGRGATEARRDVQRGPVRTVQPARRVAYDVLRAVSETDAYANLVLPPAIADARLSPQDAALATELTYGTLRRLGTYDAIIAAAADRSTDSIDPAVLDALRLAVHQLLATRVASHAAVNESVNLVATESGRGASSFANAVLRRITRESSEDWQERIESGARSDDERLALRSAHPVWVIRALRRALAAEGAERNWTLFSMPTTPRPRSPSSPSPAWRSPMSPDFPTRRPPSRLPEAIRVGRWKPRAVPCACRTGVPARRARARGRRAHQDGGALARPVRRSRRKDGTPRRDRASARGDAGGERDRPGPRATRPQGAQGGSR